MFTEKKEKSLASNLFPKNQMAACRDGSQKRSAEGEIMNRRGDWIQTFKGRKFWPLDPRTDEIDIDDIAHALSNLCRFGGHCEHFYSVAEHCVHASHIVPGELALVALLHDASEAYLIDMPRPIKRSEGMELYRQAEGQLLFTIFMRWNLNPDFLPMIKSADDRMLAVEATALFKSHPDDWPSRYRHLLTGNEPRPQCWSPAVAKLNFLNRFEQLIGLGA